MQNWYTNKVVLVIGGTSGIGKATALAFAVAFNNAGVEIVGPLDQMTEEQYRRTFDINVWGVLNSMITMIKSYDFSYFHY
jgi:NAD(P)-dependent dehydrogenase (short-subunit alcohol dehydrogenase family)